MSDSPVERIEKARQAFDQAEYDLQPVYSQADLDQARADGRNDMLRWVRGSLADFPNNGGDVEINKAISNLIDQARAEERERCVMIAATRLKDCEPYAGAWNEPFRIIAEAIRSLGPAPAPDSVNCICEAGYASTCPLHGNPNAISVGAAPDPRDAPIARLRRGLSEYHTEHRKQPGHDDATCDWCQTTRAAIRDAQEAHGDE